MAKSKTAKRYTRELREQLVKLHRAGRSIPELSRDSAPHPGPLRCGSSRTTVTPAAVMAA
jgi:hypothetical protein